MPFVVLAQQTEFKNGSLTIDFGKKKSQKEDTVQPRIITDDEAEEAMQEKKKKTKPAKQELTEDEVDWKKNGIFKMLFVAGLNATQVDGDRAYGYYHMGATTGVGAMVKFHKNISVSMELLYSMRGATKRYKLNSGAGEGFRIDWDYVEVPIGINFHDKKLVMAGVGLSFGAMVRNKLTYTHYNTAGIPDGVPAEDCMIFEPLKFDLSAYAGFQFLIKQQFGLGVRFSYSLIGLRQACTDTKVQRQYNNVLGFRFMYILNSFKKKK